MNPISVCLDLLLAVLLVATFAMGWQVNRRLRGLKASQSDFAQAVAGLDRAAQAAAGGLAQLRAATDEALDLLNGRIEKARELIARLEKLNEQGETLAKAAAAETPPVSALERAWARPPAPSAANAIATAEALVLKLSREDKLGPGPAAEPPAPARLRPWMDDDLFEEPSRPALGARGR